MDKHPITDLMDTTIQKLRDMVNVNTVIGEAITTPDGTTLIPVSKVTIGFGTGGSDIPAKGAASSSKSAFGGGGGAGMTILPIAFVVVHNGNAKILPVAQNTDSPVEKIVDAVPELLDKVSELIKKDKSKDM